MLREFICDSSYQNIINRAIEQNPLLNALWDRLKFDLQTIPNFTGELYNKGRYENTYKAATSSKNPFGKLKLLMDEHNLALDPHLIEVQFTINVRRVKIVGVQIIKNPEFNK